MDRVRRDPALITEVWHKLWARFDDPRHQLHTGSYTERSVSAATALSLTLGVDVSEAERYLSEERLGLLLAELEAYRIPEDARGMRGAGYVELCYALVRLLRPSIVIETGVALGFSTTGILEALSENETGNLYSIDLPMFAPRTEAFTAAAVPERLKQTGKWSLRIGSDRRVLPGLFEELPAIDLFFYDSDKSYRGMLGTWRVAWPRIVPGGLLVADDIHLHDAFLDFAAQLGLDATIVAKPTEQGVYSWKKTYYTGLLMKPLQTPPSSGGSSGAWRL